MLLIGAACLRASRSTKATSVTITLSPTRTPSLVRFGDRFSAFVVDLCILFVLQLLVSFVLSRLMQAAGMRSVIACTQDEAVLCEGPNTTAWIIVAVAFVVVTLSYHAYFEGVHAATPGKKLAGLRVVDAGTSASPIGLGRALVRSVVRQLFWWVLLVVFATSDSATSSTGLTLYFVAALALGLVSLVSAALSTTGRSLHDAVANSRVQPLTAHSVHDSPVHDSPVHTYPVHEEEE